jgi:hypothetical protein
MKQNGQQFLEELSGFPPNTFQATFSKTSERFGLGAALNCRELRLLYRAAYQAALCNIAMNGLGAHGGRVIGHGREADRTGLEIEFMSARERFFSSRGWKNLPAAQRGTIQQGLLRVVVRPENLTS